MALVRRMGGSSSISCYRSFPPSLLSAWLVAFTQLLDEVALAKILTGPDKTFPVYLLEQLRPSYRNRLPIIMIAFAVLMMMGTLLLALIAE